MLHCLTLHQDALTLSLHPGHFPDKKDLHEPQYKPQNAIRFLSATISLLFVVFMIVEVRG
jgi:hypothetical protein